MKGLIFILGFAAGVVFATKNPQMAASIAVWVQNVSISSGLLR